MDARDSSHLDAINRRLSEIDAALDGYAHSPSPGQYALLVERDRLRAEAAEFRTGRDSQRTSAALRAELQSLRRQLKGEISSRSGYVTSIGGSNHGASPGAWVTLAAQSRAGSDVDRLNRRVNEIEDELKRRGTAD